MPLAIAVPKQLEGRCLPPHHHPHPPGLYYGKMQQVDLEHLEVDMTGTFVERSCNRKLNYIISQIVTWATISQLFFHNQFYLCCSEIADLSSVHSEEDLLYL